MDLPKCKLCGERHRLGSCSSDGGVEADTQSSPRSVGYKPVAITGFKSDLAGVAPGPSGAKFDRVAYQREYMRKRRAKSGGPKD